MGIATTARLRDSCSSCATIEGAAAMNCPTCGAIGLLRATRDLPYTYMGEGTTISAVTGDFCSVCPGYILDPAEAARVTREKNEFAHLVNAALIDKEFIASVRKNLGLDQREAAAIFGGGVNAFSRYETGKSKPPLSLVKLLKVLDRHPHLLAEIRVT